jgi:hypothetical protein
LTKGRVLGRGEGFRSGEGFAPRRSVFTLEEGCHPQGQLFTRRGFSTRARVFNQEMVLTPGKGFHEGAFQLSGQGLQPAAGFSRRSFSAAGAGPSTKRSVFNPGEGFHEGAFQLSGQGVARRGGFSTRGRVFTKELFNCRGKAFNQEEGFQPGGGVHEGAFQLLGQNVQPKGGRTGLAAPAAPCCSLCCLRAATPPQSQEH